MTKRYLGAAALSVLAVSACWLAAATISAQPPENGPGRPKGGPEHHAAITLTSEQLARVRTLTAAAGEKYAALEKRVDQIITATQRGTAEAAKKAAKATGLKGPAEHEFVDGIVGYTEKQRAELKALDEERKSIEESLRSDIEKLLTAEQRASLPPPKGPPHKGPHEKGPRKDEPQAKGPPKHEPLPKSSETHSSGAPHEPPHVVLQRLEKKLDQLLENRK